MYLYNFWLRLFMATTLCVCDGLMKKYAQEVFFFFTQHLLEKNTGFFYFFYLLTMSVFPISLEMGKT